MKKRIAQAVVAGAIFSTALVGMPGVAQAAGADCVSVYGPPIVQDSILLRNEYCHYTARVKIIESNGPDSGCYTLAPGAEKLWQRPWYSVGRFNGLANC